MSLQVSVILRSPDQPLADRLPHSSNLPAAVRRRGLSPVPCPVVELAPRLSCHQFGQHAVEDDALVVFEMLRVGLY